MIPRDGTGKNEKKKRFFIIYDRVDSCPVISICVYGLFFSFTFAFPLTQVVLGPYTNSGRSFYVAAMPLIRIVLYI